MTNDTLTRYFNKIKEELGSDATAKTLSFYLEQIRNLVQKKKGRNQTVISDKKVQQHEADAKDQKKDQIRALEEVKKENVTDTQGVFSQASIGRLCLFQYDAKWKDKLPYWDMFPLVFPFKIEHGSTLGLNLHYLPPLQRARLMLALETLANTKEPNPQTKLYLKYKTLTEASKFRYYKPCIKKYLHTHLRSQVLIINPSKWNMTVMMPLARFQKADEYRVWQDSINLLKR